MKDPFVMVVKLPYVSVCEMLRCGHNFVHLLVEVEGNVSVLLLDVANDFLLGGGSEGAATLIEDLLEVGSVFRTCFQHACKRICNHGQS